MNKQEILSYLRAAGLAPNKAYGQHFLYDVHYIEAIVTAIKPTPNDHILEIGPGLGVLTKKIYTQVQKLTAVEIDAGFVRLLQEQFSTAPNVLILHQDFLKMPSKEGYTRIVGNLPYNVASQIIFKVAKEFTVTECFFLIQKEMAQRLLANAGSAMYSAFTVGTSLYFDARKLFDIPPQAFYPEPKVHSTFVQLIRKNEMLSVKEKELFNKLVATAFWARRKTYKTALKRSPYLQLSEEYILKAFDSLGFDTKIRGEQLHLNDFVALTRYCAHN